MERLLILRSVLIHDPLLIGGFALLVVATALDMRMRLRMFSIGDRWIFLKGGLFDYNQYLRAAAQNNWPTWPYYLFWPVVLLGLFLLAVGVFKL
jgi:hypothetical protein